jgi:putative membrane protein
MRREDIPVLRLIKSFLSEDGKKEIVEAVKKAELATSGEIVPFITSSSSSYSRSRYVVSLVAAVAATVPLTILAMHIPGVGVLYSSLFTSPFSSRIEGLWIYCLLFFPVLFITGTVVKSVPALLRMFIPATEMIEEVEETAFSEFYRSGLHKTRDQNGILIYVSLFERAVKIIADRGINEKTGPEAWSRIADTLSKGIRDKNQINAICNAVMLCGELLSSHFPAPQRNINELPDIIVKE